MRATIFTLALSVALFARAAFAVEPDQQATGAAQPAVQGQERPSQQQTHGQDHAGRGRSSDPNYRWHNGRWWYRQDDDWLMWDGGRWLNRQERVDSPAPRRSFSYTVEATPLTPGYVPTYAGLPESNASGLRRRTVGPYSVYYQRVLPSYGVRSAGSKVLGIY